MAAVAELERRLLAILAADVVGYSRRMEADEAGTIARLKAFRAEIADPLIAAHHGRLVKLMGDGALVAFASVVDAVHCAVALQKAAAARNVGLPEAERLVFRIGVNLGDVALVEEDVYGDGVNVAARLQQLCEPGGVLVSGTAFDHLQGKLDLPLEFVGEQRVKNIARPLRTYRARLDGVDTRPVGRRRWPARWWTLATAAAGLCALLLTGSLLWLWPREQAVAAKPAVAVLPFDALGGDEAARRFSDGITEDIIADLARFGDLDVIARNSTAAYQGKPLDVRRIGAELNVGYVVEGSIQRQGERTRVTAQLIDARTGAHLWANRWDRPTTDIFAVQAEVAEAVASAIGGSNSMAAVTTSRIADAKRRPPAKLTAYEHFLLAVDGKARRTKESVRSGLEHANAAVALDPELARAYSTRAFLHFFTTAYGGNAAEAIRRSEADARRAVELDPRDPEARASLAFAHAITGRLSDARTEVLRAVRDGPANIHVIVLAANILPYAGDPELAARYADKAQRLDPRMMPGNIGALPHAYFFTRRFDDALAVLLRIPDESFNRRLAFLQAATLAQLGRAAEVGPARDRLLAKYPNISAELALARELRVARPQEAELILDSFRKLGLPICAKPEDLAAMDGTQRLAACHEVTTG